MASPTYVQSLDPAGSKGVAVTLRDFGGTDTHSLAVQHMIVTDAKSDNQLSVKSYASGNPALVALTDNTGSHLSALPVSQTAGPWTVVASIPGLTSNGSVFTTQVGSWAVIQGGVTPWTVIASCAGQQTVTASVIGVPTFVGSVVVTQGAQWTTTTSVIGQLTVTASVIGVPTIQGSVLASQGGAPWTTVTSVPGQVTVTASVIGIPTFQITSGGQFIGSVVASIVGGGTGVSTPTMWAGAGDPGSGTLSVRSWISGPLLRVSLEQGTLSAGADGKLLDFNNTAIGANVTSTTGAGGLLNVVLASSGGVRTTVASDALGGLLNVNLARGSISVSGADGATLDGVDSTIRMSVKSFANSKPSAVFLVDTTGVALPFLSVVGSTGASQLGTWTVQQGTPPWTVVASVIGQPTVTASVIGPVSVVASVIGNATVTASVTGQLTVTASLIGVPVFTGSVGATQLGTWTVQQGTPPWTVVASVIGQPTVTASVIGPVSVVASVLGNVTVTASCVGQQTVTASLIGVPTFVGSVFVQGQTTQGSFVVGNPVLTGAYALDVLSGTPTGVGSAAVTQLWSDPQGRLYTKATITGSVAATIQGQTTVTASVIGIPTFVGSVGASQLGTWTVQQGNAPWTTVTSVIGNVTVTASVTGNVTVTASVTGNVTVTASCVGQQTVTASLIGVPTIQGSVYVSGIVPQGSASVGNPLLNGAYALDVVSGTTAGVNSGAITQLWADPQGRLYSKATVAGSVFAIQQGAWTVTANQGSPPWTVVASVIGVPTVTGSVGASQLGSWAVIQGGTQWTITASCIGQQTVTASVIGQVTVTASIIGNVTTVTSVSGPVNVTQVTTPFWYVVASVVGGGSSITGSVLVTNSALVVTGALGATYENHQFTIQGSLNNMSFSNSLGFLHSQSCSCVRSAFSRVGEARTISIRNTSQLTVGFRFNTASSDTVSLDGNESLYWNIVKVSDMYVTTTSVTTLRVALVP